MKKSAAGFTLIELLIAVAVLGILAAIAIPNYVDYVKRGKIPEATTGLSTIRTQMEQLYQDTRAYAFTAPAGSPANACPVTPVSANFSFTCVPAAGARPQSYRATATGQNSMTGFVYSIDQDGTHVTVAVPAGWGPAAPACWTTRKGGAC